MEVEAQNMKEYGRRDPEYGGIEVEAQNMKAGKQRQKIITLEVKKLEL